MDRGIYLADDENRTYIFLERNRDWKGLEPADNEANKKSIDWYTRIFRDGSRKVFRSKQFKGQTGKGT